MKVNEPSNVHPINLRRMAKSIASSRGEKGAVIITFGDEGYSFGVEGMSPEEVEQAACILIHQNFLVSEDGIESAI